MASWVASGAPADAEPSRISFVSYGPLIIAAVTFLLFDNAHRLLDPDTYLHLAAGQWMLAHGSIPDSDPFSQTMRGAPWVSHEWLAEILIALAYRAGGWAGVVVLSVAAFAAAAAFLARYLLRHLQPIHVVALITLAELTCLPHLVARPHVLAMPLMVLWTGGMLDAAADGKPPNWLLLPVMTLWANLHGGFTLGLCIAALLAVEAAMTASTREEAFGRLRGWATFLVLAVASTLISPHPIAGLQFAANLFKLDYSLSIVDEWRSPDFHELQPIEVWLMLALAVILSKGLRLPPVRLVLLLGLIHLGLKYARSAELVGLLAPLVVAGPLAMQLRPTAAKSRIDHLFERFLRPASPPAIAGGLAALAVLTVVVAASAPPRPAPAITPDNAVAAARAAGLDGPVLNAYGFGGYLIFAGIAPYIDGRVDLYGDAYLREVIDATMGQRPGALSELLDRRAIEWTLLQPEMPAVFEFDHMPGWRRVYADDHAVVHARVGSKVARQAP